MMATTEHPLFGVLPDDPAAEDAVVRELLRDHPVIVGQSSPSKMFHVLRELDRTLECGVPGAIVELGCFEGETTLMMRRLLDRRGHASRDLHVYDSWDGVPSPLPHDVPPAGMRRFERGFCATRRESFD